MGFEAWMEDGGFVGVKPPAAWEALGSLCLAGCNRGRVVLDFLSLMIFSFMSVHGYCEKQFIVLL